MKNQRCILVSTESILQTALAFDAKIVPLHIPIVIARPLFLYTLRLISYCLPFPQFSETDWHLSLLCQERKMQQQSFSRRPDVWLQRCNFEPEQEILPVPSNIS